MASAIPLSRSCAKICQQRSFSARSAWRHSVALSNSPKIIGKRMYSRKTRIALDRQMGSDVPAVDRQIAAECWVFSDAGMRSHERLACPLLRGVDCIGACRTGCRTLQDRAHIKPWRPVSESDAAIGGSTREPGLRLGAFIRHSHRPYVRERLGIWREACGQHDRNGWRDQRDDERSRRRHTGQAEHPAGRPVDLPAAYVPYARRQERLGAWSIDGSSNRASWPQSGEGSRCVICGLPRR